MKIIFVGALLTLALIKCPASAGTVEDCNQILNADLRLRACTEITEQSTYKPNEKAAAFSSLGETNANAGDARAAFSDFDASIRLNKNSPGAFSGRARAMLAAGDVRGAIADYGEAIRLSPGAASLYVARGHAFTVSQNLGAALRDLDQAVKLDPGSWSAHNERGVAYFRKGDFGQAERDFTQAISIAPLPDIYTNRGKMYEALNKKDEAIKDLRHALVNDPSIVDASDALQRLGLLDPVIAEAKERVQEGQKLAEANCSGCHAIGLSGSSPNHTALEFRNFYRQHPLLTLRASITQGVLATHTKMPQFNLSSEKVDQVVAYMNSLSSQR